MRLCQMICKPTSSRESPCGNPLRFRQVFFESANAQPFGRVVAGGEVVDARLAAHVLERDFLLIRVVVRAEGRPGSEDRRRNK